jgi:hypothetical protein
MESVATVEWQTRAAAREGTEGESRPAAEPSWKRERTRETDVVLLDATLTWMARLPRHVRPMVLGARYPRIANNIAGLWRRVARCEDYLDTLVVDRRGNRAGFPPDVAQELNNLRGFYAELHPRRGSCWDHAGATM